MSLTSTVAELHTIAELHAALLEIFVAHGQKRHSSLGITHLQHAVQAGALARSAGLPPTLTTAALLHDIGHLLSLTPNSHVGHNPDELYDETHALLAADWLSCFFGPAVTEPVRLHVAAKRYLSATDPAYIDKLSQSAFTRLLYQGGPMSINEQQDFCREQYYREAVLLCQIDDMATDPDGPQPHFGSFWLDIEASMAESSGAARSTVPRQTIGQLSTHMRWQSMQPAIG